MSSRHAGDARSEVAALPGGLYDIVIVTLPRCHAPSLICPDPGVVRSVPAVQRELVLKVRETEKRIESLERKEKAGKLDEEQEEELPSCAKLKGMAGTRAQGSHPRRTRGRLPAKVGGPAVGQEPDPASSGRSWASISWATTRAMSEKPLDGGHARRRRAALLGSPQEGSYIAWQLYLRSFLVRKEYGRHRRLPRRCHARQELAAGVPVDPVAHRQRHLEPARHRRSRAVHHPVPQHSDAADSGHRSRTRRSSLRRRVQEPGPASGSPLPVRRVPHRQASRPEDSPSRAYIASRSRWMPTKRRSTRPPGSLPVGA